MFFAERLSLGHILLLEKDASKFIEALLDTGLVQIEDTYDLLDIPIPKKFDFKNESTKLDLLESRVEALCRILDVDVNSLSKGDWYEFVKDISLEPSELSQHIASDIDRVEKNVTEIISLIEKRKEFIFNANQISWFLSILVHSGLEYIYELNRELISYWIGSIPKTNLAGLYEALHDVPAVIEYANASRDRMMILLISIPSYGQRIASALKAGGFLEVDISGLDVHEPINTLLEDLEFAIWEAREEIAELTSVLNKKRDIFFELLAKLYKLLMLERRIVNAMSMCSGSSFFVVVNIWVREKDRARLEKVLNQRLDSVIEFDWVSPKELDIEPENVPAAFNVSGLWDSFFKLIETYGYPAFNEINPLFIFTVASILMYGFMFADVGHGLVLFVLGLLSRKKNRVFSDILSSVGISSIVWGLVFGSIFGREDIIRPLWVAPLSDPLRPMILSVIIGGVYLSIGMLFFIINKLRNDNYFEAVFGEWGLGTLMLYSSLFLMALFRHSYPFLLFMLFSALGIIIYGILREMRHKDISEVLFTPIEVFISMFANTISFVRLAAFAVNHAALMIVVFVLADMLKGLGLSGIFLFLGNIFVIVLEAVLVMIQTLRLQYYEFFSKFYTGNGRKFIPLRW